MSGYADTVEKVTALGMPFCDITRRRHVRFRGRSGHVANIGWGPSL